MDLICWLNGASRPAQVSCFGHRRQFIQENKPEGAAEYCFDCPLERECPYSALRMHYDHDVMPFLTWDSMNKPYNEVTKEEKEAFLRKDIYGKCVFDCGGDVMDRQNLLVDFADGSVATFTLSCGTCRPDRYIHIVGTEGEVEGKLEENKFIYRTYNRETVSFREEIVDIAPQVVNKAKYGGHSGGDYGIMYDLVRYLNGERASASITLLEDSIASHLLVYAAEESRKTERFVKL
jgi:predicted dehydrogenase